MRKRTKNSEVKSQRYNIQIEDSYITSRKAVLLGVSTLAKGQRQKQLNLEGFSWKFGLRNFLPMHRSLSSCLAYPLGQKVKRIFQFFSSVPTKLRDFLLNDLFQFSFLTFHQNWEIFHQYMFFIQIKRSNRES